MGAVIEGGGAIGAELAEKLKRADAGVTGPEAPGASQPAGVTASGAAVVDESHRWIEAAARYGRLVRKAMPQLQADWTDENLHEFGVELAACAKHYDWKWGSALTHPLARLAAAGWPLAAPLVLPYVMPYIVKLLAPPEVAIGSDAAGDAAGAAVTVKTGDAAAPVIQRVKPLEFES